MFHNNYGGYFDILANISFQLWEKNRGHHYQSACNALLDIIGTNEAKNLLNVFPGSVVVFEGERCSGKDSIISMLCQDVSSDYLVALPRIVRNSAWEILNQKKQNCYFNLDNVWESVLLWFSDLCFRVSSWLRLIDAEGLSIINRYILSCRFCILSNYSSVLAPSDLQSVQDTLDNLMVVFPQPSCTVILDVGLKTALYRMRAYRSKELSVSEQRIMQQNICRFCDVKGGNIFHVDAEKDLLQVYRDVKELCTL